MKKALSLILVLVFAFSLGGCALNTDFLISGSMTTDGEKEAFLENSYAVLSLNAEQEPYLLRVQAYLDGSENPIEATFTASSQGLGIYCPLFLDAYYMISWNAFKDAAEQATPFDLDNFNPEDLPVEDISEIAERYGNILMGLVTENNTTVADGTFALPGLGETVSCTVMKIQPTQEEWNTFFTTLASTALTDEQLRPLIVKGLEAAYTSGQVENAEQYDSAEAYSAATMKQFDEFLTMLKDDPDAVSSQIVGVSLEAGYTDDRFYGCRFMKDGEGIGYENFTYEAAGEDEADTRCDALYLYSGEEATDLLVNQLSVTDEAIVDYVYSTPAELSAGLNVDMTTSTIFDIPQVYFGFNVQDAEFSAGVANDDEQTGSVIYIDTVIDEGNTFYLQAYSDGSPSDVTAPAEEPVMINTMDELMQVISAVAESVS